MTGVQLRNLGIRYGQVEVLKGIDLDIPPSEFIVLLGPSGCGKSTLLNAIAGLQDVAEGQILIGGHDMTNVEPKNRGIAMVFQSYALYPRMSVRGNLSFGLKVAGTAKPEIEKRVANAARMLQIEPLLDRKPSELSGGQRQRVAIGRAVVRDAGVFLFDEPLSNLDAQLRSDLRVEIKRLHQRLKSTMIYVTHDQIEAMTLADRIVVMKDRIIQQQGTPDEIYNKPANTFVARFVGSPAMNFLDAAVEGGDAIVDGKTVHIASALSSQAPLADGRNVIVGIRPEDVVLHTDEAASGLAVEIDVVEPMGAEKLVWCKRGSIGISTKIPASVSIKPGDKAWLGLSEQCLHIFDADSGKRM
ncbi:sn-glycerol-3-phosphate ABC transporter ATP-binding protein UgpC [Rhizobium brockwellii]|uniref:Sn-glycerol-3-phosphate ABC transporter ATP-binding protein UgpC n=1 Tax=Rhizobium brockwellii TaxID=3019932 RepID=A0ABU3YKT2_9HYPH|nr:sn-glycerol-3-phosphate ABC transporter ATP-binding protein UgpC [Rhizobium brockwellii]MDV4179251.1 sn-glycerol-3-phosphate ABC transporter ATP-binding protein UgpC [Rhizobium brockwellii]MDV4186439.1 sn-glycerol-3-phosphate ABC transporter ATP-binding protein UgpC [Rhizobium brockwellii]